MQTYDYACALHEEVMIRSVTISVWILTIRRPKWEFLRRSRWTKVKALYIMTRHLPFFLIVMYLCRASINSGTIFLTTIDVLYFSELRRDRRPQCMWIYSGLTLILTARVRQKCRILINVYSCTYTVHAPYGSLSSDALPLTAFSQISIICSECICSFLHNIYAFLIRFIQVFS